MDHKRGSIAQGSAVTILEVSKSRVRIEGKPWEDGWGEEPDAGRGIRCRQSRTLQSTEAAEAESIEGILKILESARPLPGHAHPCVTEPCYVMIVSRGEARTGYFLKGPFLKLPNGKQARSDYQKLKGIIDGLLEGTPIQEEELSKRPRAVS